MIDAVVIGAGPGGFTAAPEIAKRGGKVVLVEKNKVGGVCLNTGCTPTKAMVHDVLIGKEFQTMMERKAKVVKVLHKGLETELKNSVELVYGEAVIKGPNTVKVDGIEYETKNIVIATGSECSLPECFQSKNVITSEEVLNIEKVPDSIVIIGGGAIGCEYAGIFNRLGAKVELLEALPRILPYEDEETSELMEKILKKQGISISTGTPVKEINGNTVILDERELSAEIILVAVGRVPSFPKELDELGIEYDRKGIKVNGRLQTSVPNIYAVGDCIGGLMLAHAAYHEARIAARNIMGENIEIDNSAVPRATYTMPEAASVGLTEKEALEKGLDISIGKVPLMAVGMARVVEERDGYAKVLFDKGAKQIVGVHLIGKTAVDTIGSASALMNVPYEKLKNVVFPHPALSENLYKAMLTAVELCE